MGIRADAACHTTTIQRYLKRIGYRSRKLRKIPMLTQTHKDRRLLWATENRERDWGWVVFSDECSFWLNTVRGQVWVQTPEEAFVPATSHSEKIYVWGAISQSGKISLHTFRGNLNAVAYRTILQDHLLARANAVLGPTLWTFQQDNSPVHRARILQTWLLG